LLSEPPGFFAAKWFHALGYLSAVGLLATGVWWRRRNEADPIARQQRQAAVNTRQDIASATSVAAISHAIRQLVATRGPGNRRAEIDALLAQCDAAQYSRSEPQPCELEALRSSALELLARRGAS